jgi:TPR repeat protein
MKVKTRESKKYQSIEVSRKLFNISIRFCVAFLVCINIFGQSPIDSSDQTSQISIKKIKILTLNELNELINKNNTAAQNELGERYLYGKGVIKDFNEAFRWFSLAANSKNSEAQTNLGRIYYLGYGVPKDIQKSIGWLKLAAENGNASAASFLSLIYFRGNGVPEDKKAGFKWLLLAAENGDPDSQYSIGEAYYYGSESNISHSGSGLDIKKDIREAINWFRKSANQDNPWAQIKLGECFEKGIGVPNNLASADEWYQRAAAQGNKIAIEKIKSRNTPTVTITDINDPKLLSDQKPYYWIRTLHGFDGLELNTDFSIEKLINGIAGSREETIKSGIVKREHLKIQEQIQFFDRLIVPGSGLHAKSDGFTPEEVKICRGMFAAMVEAENYINSLKIEDYIRIYNKIVNYEFFENRSSKLTNPSASKRLKLFIKTYELVLKNRNNSINLLHRCTKEFKQCTKIDSKPTITDLIAFFNTFGKLPSPITDTIPLKNQNDIIIRLVVENLLRYKPMTENLDGYVPALTFPDEIDALKNNKNILNEQTNKLNSLPINNYAPLIKSQYILSEVVESQEGISANITKALDSIKTDLKKCEYYHFKLDSLWITNDQKLNAVIARKAEEDKKFTLAFNYAEESIREISTRLILGPRSNDKGLLQEPLLMRSEAIQTLRAQPQARSSRFWELLLRQIEQNYVRSVNAMEGQVFLDEYRKMKEAVLK